MANYKERVSYIKEVADDYEKAHVLEDKLRHDILTEIAHGRLTREEMKDIAKIALSTSGIQFSRLCA